VDDARGAVVEVGVGGGARAGAAQREGDEGGGECERSERAAFHGIASFRSVPRMLGALSKANLRT
jgi:hypothetical protein